MLVLVSLVCYCALDLLFDELRDYGLLLVLGLVICLRVVALLRLIVCALFSSLVGCFAYGWWFTGCELFCIGLVWLWVW